MNKTTIIISSIIVLLTAFLGAAVLYFKQFAPKYNWNVTLRYNEKEPYDTKLLYMLLEDTYNKENFSIIHSRLKEKIDDAKTNNLVFFIGNYAYYDSVTTQSLKDFIYRGNSLCIASNSDPSQLLSFLTYYDTVENIINDYNSPLIHTHFTCDTNKKYNFHHQILKDTGNYNWGYLTKTKLSGLTSYHPTTYLSLLDKNYINFIKINYGKGSIFIYTTPILLSNYYLSTEEGYSYALRFFNEIGKHEKFIWDNSSLVFANIRSRSLDSENLLEFILSKKSLRWAWYLSITGIILFILFRLKRQQKPVPVLTPDKNASIEYAKAVGLLYYKTSSHQDLSEHMMKLFYNFIKTRYNLNIKEEKESLIKHVSVSSGMKKEEISIIFDAHIKVKFNPQAEAGHTLKLHSTLENFYKNCK